MSPELRILITPRRAYAHQASAPAFYIPFYILFLSLLIAACAATSATGRVTLSLLLSLGAIWMFVPVLHVSMAAGLVASARASRPPGRPAVALLLMGHAPWSLWMLLAAVMAAAFGFAAWRPMLVAALVPVALTFRILHAFCLEVLRTTERGAVVRAIAHQAITWAIAAVYLEKAVGLVPRIHGWLS